MAQLKVILNGSSYAVMAMLAETNGAELVMDNEQAVFSGLSDYNGIEAYIISDNSQAQCEVI